MTKNPKLRGDVSSTRKRGQYNSSVLKTLDISYNIMKIFNTMIKSIKSCVRKPKIVSPLKHPFKIRLTVLPKGAVRRSMRVWLPDLGGSQLERY